MSLTPEILATFQLLKTELEASRPDTKLLNSYYEGVQRLEQLGLAIPDELKKFSVIADWPRTVVDSKEQRLDVTGFRMPGSDGAADADLWAVWQYNDMDERQTAAHTEALALKRSYVCVGTNEIDAKYPLISVESALEMTALRDPRTHEVTSALRMYDADDQGADRRATVYLPNMTLWLIRNGTEWTNEFEPDTHNLGRVPVVPLINRGRPTRLDGAKGEGVSEMAGIIPLADSASRALTNAQLALETHAVPQRGVLGASKGDFVDKDGNPIPAWEAYFGSIWALGNESAKTFQFDASDMTNFETMVNLYSRLASGVASLPVEYFGVTMQNAPSADGQRAGETRLIKSAERKQVSFGHAWEQVMRLVLRFRDGSWNEDARRMETLWRDAGTPTLAQVTDAVTKEYQAGLTDWETAQETLGRSPQQISRMKERRNAENAAALGYGVQAATEAL